MICIHLIFSHLYLAKISPIWRKTLSNQSASQSYFSCCEILSSMKVIMIPSVNPNYQYMYHFVFNKETISIYIIIYTFILVLANVVLGGGGKEAVPRDFNDKYK